VGCFSPSLNIIHKIFESPIKEKHFPGLSERKEQLKNELKRGRKLSPRN